MGFSLSCRWDLRGVRLLLGEGGVVWLQGWWWRCISVRCCGPLSSPECVGGMLFKYALGESCFLTTSRSSKKALGSWITLSMRLIRSHRLALSSPLAHFYSILYSQTSTWRHCSFSAHSSRHTSTGDMFKRSPGSYKDHRSMVDGFLNSFEYIRKVFHWDKPCLSTLIKFFPWLHCNIQSHTVTVLFAGGSK